MNPKETTSPSLRYLNLSALVFAALQWACPAFIALGAMRVVIGAGALAMAAVPLSAVASLHRTAIRIPMELLALTGAVLNLFVLWQVRRLRNRPAAQWRLTPVSSKTLRSERWQIALSVLTLVLLSTEWITHLVEHHTI
jgi:hypothetical protein